MSQRIIAAVSLAIAGEPIIYIADPLGKAFSILGDWPMHLYPDRSMASPGHTIPLRNLGVAKREEVEVLRVRGGFVQPLADRAWYEVQSD